MENQETFETALGRLEKIVHDLEAGTQTLDESLSAFEEGIRLVRFCSATLSEAEQKVKLLLDDGTEGNFANKE